MGLEIIAGIIAGVVSILVGVISFVSNRASTQHEVRQGQYSEILLKRVELYPLLWRIHIKHETNWVIEKKDKDREWAKSYLDEINEFNIQGGLFFSQGLYRKFTELRDLLCRAVEETNEGALVNTDLVYDIRKVVYGLRKQPGLSTYEKDDLGSYRNLSIQRRSKDA